ncbi:unnamed protein product, partial [Vitis vinifera]
MSSEHHRSTTSRRFVPSPEIVVSEMENDTGDADPANEDIQPEITLFGKYAVGKLLGYGAFAKVYHARNIRTGQSVAIKAVSKKKVMKGGLTAHVKREISIMRRLRHPHIVKLYEVLATKTKIYFQLISAIGYCHSRGVFHRDLKPENLLLDENWNLKVSDFGLSAVKDQIRADGLLHTLCGTPAYVAPEILAKKGYDGTKVDIWTCGIILYVLNAGYLPFNDPNLMGMYRKIYKGEFRCPKWTSPDMRRLLSRLLDTNPETRITVDEIIRDPWFQKGYKEIKFHVEDFDFKDHDDDDDNAEYMNAFHIISFSSGFEFSSMLNDSGISVAGERFVSAESPEKIIEKVEDVAKKENVTVTRKENWGVMLEGQNGNFALIMEIYRLTEKLVLVEVRKKEILYIQAIFILVPSLPFHFSLFSPLFFRKKGDTSMAWSRFV